MNSISYFSLDWSFLRHSDSKVLVSETRESLSYLPRCKFISLRNYTELSKDGKSIPFSLLDTCRNFSRKPQRLVENGKYDWATLPRDLVSRMQVKFFFFFTVHGGNISSLLSKLVCTKIKTPQSFCVHFLRFNLNFQRNISPKHDKGHGYAFVKQVKSFPKMHKASFLFARK